MEPYTYVVICVSHVSIRITISRCSNIVACISISFLFYGQTCQCMDIPNFVYLLISWWTLGEFLLFAVRNNAAMDICVQVLAWMYTFNSLQYIPRNWIGESYVTVFLQTTKLLSKADRVCLIDHFIFSLTLSQGSNFSTASSILIIFFFLS